MDVINRIEGMGTDCSLDDINIDYETISFSFSYNDQTVVTVSCCNYISYSCIGHWDESIISNIEIEENGDLIAKSLESVRKYNGDCPLPGGGIKKIDDKWYQLNIKMIDGNVIKIVCNDFGIEIQE